MNIEEAKKEIQELVDMLGSRQDREDLAIIYNFMKKQKAELEKKDKIIDEAIKIIANVTVPQEKCKQCIKEYFTNKVEREGK